MVLTTTSAVAKGLSQVSTGAASWSMAAITATMFLANRWFLSSPATNSELIGLFLAASKKSSPDFD